MRGLATARWTMKLSIAWVEMAHLWKFREALGVEEELAVAHDLFFAVGVA